MKNSSTNHRNVRAFLTLLLTTAVMIAVLSSGPLKIMSPQSAHAGSTYFNLASGILTFNVSASTANQITSNDNWTNVPSVEGYCGSGLANTFGVNPQTIVAAEFTNSTLPSSASTCVAANKGNPSAYNAGGLAEFDSGPYLAIGMQGNVQARAPYMVFYGNMTGRSNINFAFTATDIDGGSNNSVSQVALQYRVGGTGNFTNIPAGYIADVTDGGVAGRSTTRSVTLPAAANNQPNVQVRIITTDAAAPDGTSSPDEWIGINNVIFGNIAPSAAMVSVSGRAVTSSGMGISKSRVSMWDDMGNLRTTLTNGFGYYTFSDVEVGRSYVFEISSKRYAFQTPIQFITVNDAICTLDFVAD